MSTPISLQKNAFVTFPGAIHLINTNEELQMIVAKLKSITELGFDTETKPSFRKGEVYKVALLQLSTESDAFIIRMQKIDQFSILKEIFENDQIAKAGVAIRDDIKQLQKIFNFSPKNFHELQDLARLRGLKNFGLKGMTEEVLQARLSKGSKLTNWEATELSELQLMYAATDAWIGLKLFQKLRQDSNLSH